MTTTPGASSESHARIAEGLYTTGWHVERQFVDPVLLRELRAESLARWEAGSFRHARVGTGAEKRLQTEVRRDQVCWLDETDLTPAQSVWWNEIELLRRAVNEALFLGLFSYEGHLTVYPPGAFYRKHLDNFRGARHRRVTAILYLNDGWKREDGGQLRLYLDESGDGPFVDIEPLGGTLVTFLSERFYHEVLPATRERLSMTGWFRTRD